MLCPIFMPMIQYFICSSSSALKPGEFFQSAFDSVQSRSADTSKTLYGVETEAEVLKSYKCWGLLIDENLSSKLHIDKRVSELKLKLDFFFRDILCFSLKINKHLIGTTFLSLMDYGDLLFMNADDHF